MAGGISSARGGLVVDVGRRSDKHLPVALVCSLKGFDKETKKNANLEDITCFEENQLSTEI